MPRRAPSRLLWEPRPAANGGLRPAQKAKASPRGRGSYRKPRRAPSRLLWEPRPAAKAGSRPAQKQKLRPEGGAPTRSRGAHRAAFCGSRDPRRMRATAGSKAKASPRGRASYKKATARTERLLWEPRPAANASLQPAQKQSFAPRAGLLQEATARTEPSFVGGATRGEWGLAARSKSKSFAPRAGLLPEATTRTEPPFVGGATRGEWGLAARSKSKSCAPRAGLLQRKPKRAPSRLLSEPRPAANGGLRPAQKAKASPRGRGSYKESQSAHRAAFVGSAPRLLPDPRKTKPRTRRGLSSSRPASGRACPRRLYQALIRDLYSPVRVSISIESPISQKAETCSSAPFFRRAVFMTLPEVSPRTDGSV